MKNLSKPGLFSFTTLFLTTLILVAGTIMVNAQNPDIEPPPIMEPPPVLWDEVDHIFSFSFGDQLKETFAKKREISGDRLSELLAQECAISYKGKEAIAGQVVIFFASGGKLRQVISSNTLQLEPPLVELGKNFPARKFEEAFSKAFRSEEVPVSMLIPEAEHPLLAGVFREGNYEEVLYEKINWKHMKDGIGMLFVPEREILNKIGDKAFLVSAILMIGETEKN